MLLGGAQKMARHGAGQLAIQHGQTSSDQDDAVEPGAQSPATAPKTPVIASAMSFEDELDAVFGMAPSATDTMGEDREPLAVAGAMDVTDRVLEDLVDLVGGSAPPTEELALEDQTFFF